MGKSWIFVVTIVGVLLLGSVLFVASRSTLQATEIDWRLLGELDYVTGYASEDLKAFDNQKIKMPGFMVPLEDNLRKVTEFLLVPNAQACIHMPPPPPNQMVHVQMKSGGVPTAYGPIWVYGNLKIITTKSVYGDSSFEITADGIEPYE